MPIFRIDIGLVYFAHVPKCAGSAVEQYLAKRFGPIGFLDRTYLDVPKRRRWSASSPQHIDAATLDRLLPAEFFAARFAVVRHPVDRMISVFRYQRDIERTLPLKTSFGDWLESLPDLTARRPFHLDNHVRPMTDLVPEGAKVFRLEQGLEPIIGWLDALTGEEGEPRHFRHVNVYDLRKGKRRAAPAPEINDRVLAQIAGLHAADFERFGYVPEDCAARAAEAT